MYINTIFLIHVPLYITPVLHLPRTPVYYTCFTCNPYPCILHLLCMHPAPLYITPVLHVPRTPVYYTCFTCTPYPCILHLFYMYPIPLYITPVLHVPHTPVYYTCFRCTPYPCILHLFYMYPAHPYITPVLHAHDNMCRDNGYIYMLMWLSCSVACGFIYPHWKNAMVNSYRQQLFFIYNNVDV